MLYAIISEDVPNSLERRLAARPDHLARLEALRDEGRVVLAGPHPAIDADNPGDAGFSGSLVVAEFDSLEEANAWADADPYMIAGVYAKVIVKPFKKFCLDPNRRVWRVRPLFTEPVENSVQTRRTLCAKPELAPAASS
ncbi:hypothetical protein HSBAA_11100 [Vreelandella sulfidaeris]|uniref:YCII-related domain-containing protein n=1 Tax=Vreelandella sulfidaeris TaxID=115553 RepID=A0A455U8N6_9GAMM|nr:hypothetical protein HSBAA_11100 [Halomonas sulfidaeris]